MADRLSAYADWLVANQNKRGTPEFDQVANAYKQLRQQPANEPTSNIFAGMANSALRIAGGATDMLPTINKALTGYENPRIHVPGDKDQLLGIDWKNILDTRMRDATDPALEGSTNPAGFDGTEFEAAADSIYETQRKLNYQPNFSYQELKKNPTAKNILGFMGEAAVTSLPDMAVALVSAPLYFSSYVAPIAEARAKNDGRDQVTPADLSAAVVAAAAIATAERIGAKAVFSRGTGNVVTRPLKAGGAEMVTEAVQNPIEGFARAGGTQTGYSQAEAIDDIGAGALGGFGAGTGIRAGLDVAGGVKNAVTGDTASIDQEAAGDFSRRLGSIVDSNNLNLSNLDKTSTTGARQAVDIAHSQIGADMRQLIKDLKAKLNVDRLDPAETVADKVLAEAGTAEARTKTKSVVGQQEYDATERLVGDTAEGQRLLRLFRESNELTRLHNSGYVGGLSQYTDQLSPLASNVGYTARSAAELPTRLLGTAAGYTLNPAIPATQLAAVGTGRAVDALTGRRSRVRKYIRDNQANPGVDIGNQPSLREQAITQDEENRQRDDALRQDMLNFNDPPKGSPTDPNPSPEYIMQSETGLDRDGVEQALQIVANTRPKLKKAVESYREMLRKGTQVDDLNFLIPAVKTAVRQNADKFNPQQINPASQTNQANESEGYRRGIEANRKFADDLKAKLEADTTLSPVDKQLTRQALDEMQLNVGIDPVSTVNQIKDDAVGAAQNKPKVQSYLQPYVDRVERQQKNRPQTEEPNVEFQQTITPNDEPGPALAFNDTFGIGDDIDTTNLPIYPAEGYRPAGDTDMSLNEAVKYLHDRWEQSTGRTEPFEYTPENIERIAKMMAAEAERALQDDTNAIGWYDRKLKAAKAVLALVEPRIFDSADNEAAFDLALAVTSNGAAVADNFANAVEVFRGFLNTGKMPADTWIKGGERNESMVKAFEFYNAYQAAREKGRLNIPFQDFMDLDFTVRELVEYIDKFNKANGTDIQLSVSENMDTDVKGSFVLGAKIGQGFYQNIRGNYQPLTMDIWWMRMWNRLVGRPFAESKESDMVKNRKKIANFVKEAFKPNSGMAVERKLVRQALDRLGENRVGLYGDPVRMDAFITALDSRWQSYFKRYQKENGKNPPKPKLFKVTGTHTKNLKGKLQATPAGGGERQVMRQATARAIELLNGIGYDIATADFQALMWYPEKRLFRSLGVPPGRGEDNDYLDAAIILANEEGISDDKIQEALPDSERGGVNPGPSAEGQDGSVRGGSERVNREGSSQDTIDRQRQLTFDFDGGQQGSPDQGRSTLSRIVGSRPADPAEVRDAKAITDPVFDIGKPGSPFENGIPDVETAKKLAAALNAALYIAPNKTGLARVFGKSSLGRGFTMGGAQMTKSPAEKATDRQTGEKREAVIGLLDVYKNPRNPREEVTPLQLLWASLHEIGHVLEGRFVPGKTSTKADPKYLRASDKRQIRSDKIYQNTFRRVIASIMDAAGGIDYQGVTQQDAQDIIDEIIRFQRTGVLSMMGENLPARGDYELFAEAIEQAEADNNPAKARRFELQLMAGEDSYFQTPNELAADLIGFYLIDPQRAKKEMPKGTKLVREILNQGDGTVKFFSMPLAALVAAIFANMMVAEGEEEEQRGILSLGQGALTA